MIEKCRLEPSVSTNDFNMDPLSPSVSVILVRTLKYSVSEEDHGFSVILDPWQELCTSGTTATLLANKHGLLRPPDRTWSPNL